MEVRPNRSRARGSGENGGWQEEVREASSPRVTNQSFRLVDNIFQNRDHLRALETTCVQRHSDERVLAAVDLVQLAV